jgi:Ca2+-transporting ATPase
MDDSALRAALPRTSAFARISPDDKARIVRAQRAAGTDVAFLCDGVNGRRAPVGEGSGGTGCVVAEGRWIFANTIKYVLMGTSNNFGNMFSAAGASTFLPFLPMLPSQILLIGPFLGLAVPLLPAQILWVNLLTHGLPGVALGAEPASPGGMARPPRSPQESVLGAGLTRSVLIGGSVIAACVLGAALGADRLGAPWQSVGFVVLGLAQLGVALAVRAPRRPRQHGGSRNPGLAAAVALSAVLQIAAVTWEPLRVLLGTESLTPAQFAACAGVAAVPGGALAVVRALARRQGRRRGRRSPRVGTSGPAAAPAAKATLESTEEVSR